MEVKNFELWLKKVDEELRAQGKKMYLKAWKVCLKQCPYPDMSFVRLYGKEAVEATPLIHMRGDEPWDCWRMQQSAEEYAKFLLDEWKIHGPEGE